MRLSVGGLVGGRPRFGALSALKFQGIADELRRENQNTKETQERRKLQALLDSERVFLTLNGKPMKALAVLELVAELEAAEHVKDRWAASAMGAVGSIVATVAVGSFLAPLVAFPALYGFLTLIKHGDAHVGYEQILNLDFVQQNQSGKDCQQVAWAMGELARAGLVENFSDFCRLTSKGRKVLKAYRKGELRSQLVTADSQTLSKNKVLAPLAPMLEKPVFSYETLAGDERMAVFEILMSAGSSGEKSQSLSGFQFLEKLQAREDSQGFLRRWMGLGVEEKSLMAVLSKEDQVWGRELFEKFKAQGWVRQEGSDVPRWVLTTQGRTVVKRGDPVFTGVMTPEDLQQLFQIRIERLEAEKEKQYQRLLAVQAEHATVLKTVQELEDKLTALEKPPGAFGKDTGGKPTVPLSVQIERVQRELALNRKLSDRFKLAVEGQALLLKKNSEKIDAKVTELMDGQVRVRVLKLDHSIADILKQLQQESGVLQGTAEEALLAQLPASGQDVSGGKDQLSLALSADAILDELKKATTAKVKEGHS